MCTLVFETQAYLPEVLLFKALYTFKCFPCLNYVLAQLQLRCFPYLVMMGSQVVAAVSWLISSHIYMYCCSQPYPIHQRERKLLAPGPTASSACLAISSMWHHKCGHANVISLLFSTCLHQYQTERQWDSSFIGSVSSHTIDTGHVLICAEPNRVFEQKLKILTQKFEDFLYYRLCVQSSKWDHKTT